ncbi:unnamed protein product [marine sediment metagenome]|uniref:Uncharacterized protein n=1 Tax=marine sediment metagenome TaxID=412755 RepID=X1QZL6_9ZZZZ
MSLFKILFSIFYAGSPVPLGVISDKPEYARAKNKLAAALMAELKATKDPRVLGKGDAFDKYPY